MKSENIIYKELLHKYGRISCPVQPVSNDSICLNRVISAIHVHVALKYASFIS